MQMNGISDVFAQDVETATNANLPWGQLSGCRILVSGAGGFLGGYLVRCLLSLHRLGKIEEPINVIAMVRDKERACGRLSDIICDPFLTMTEWDLSKIAVPEIGPCHYVLHTASQASPRFYGIDPVGTLLPNAIGTAALLEAFWKQGTDRRGFLFVSSSEVYGTAADLLRLTESDYGVSDPATVRSCYAESKRIGETLCVSWTHQYGVPTFIVRPFHTYGPGLQKDDGRVFADFAFAVIRGQNIEMESDGSARRAYCYVTDAIAGIFFALLKGDVATPYNVANPSGELSVLELAELLVSLYPEKGLRVVRCTSAASNYLPSKLSRLVPDVSRLAALGWSPMVMPASGFRRMIEAYSL